MSFQGQSGRDYYASSARQGEQSVRDLLQRFQLEIARQEASLEQLRALTTEQHHELAEMREFVRASKGSCELAAVVSDRVKKLEEETSHSERDIEKRRAKLEAAKLKHNESKSMLEAVEASQMSVRSERSVRRSIRGSRESSSRNASERARTPPQRQSPVQRDPSTPTRQASSSMRSPASPLAGLPRSPLLPPSLSGPHTNLAELSREKEHFSPVKKAFAHTAINAISNFFKTLRLWSGALQVKGENTSFSSTEKSSSTSEFH
eukprot:3871818-Pleurochrysis_carterae.AAC.2